MTCYFVSRHDGAIEWIRQRGIAIDQWVPHLDVAQIASGDTVIGTLPIQLAAQVCKRGATYLHLSLTVPPEWRGRELSAEELDCCGAQLQRLFIVTQDL